MTILNPSSSLSQSISGGNTALDREVAKTKSQQGASQETLGSLFSPSTDDNSLPSSKVPSNRRHSNTRKIMKFFVPEVGVVNMYVNPQSITYNFEKLISNEMTKGGHVIQYWGEQLPKLSIRGNTGSSGVEGLNVLYEVYRSEQLTFDSIGLTIASNSSMSGIGDSIDNAFSQLGNAAGTFSSITNGLFGLDPLTQTLMPSKPKTLAELASGVEIYYSGWVFRGYFTSFEFSESVEQLGLFSYNMSFTVTQRRGYRTNYMPWHRSAIDGPSNNSTAGGIPLSFNGIEEVVSSTTPSTETVLVKNQSLQIPKSSILK